MVENAMSEEQGDPERMFIGWTAKNRCGLSTCANPYIPHQQAWLECDSSLVKNTARRQVA